MKTFSPKTVDQWRQWLSEHHDSESEVWLVFHKRHTGGTSIDYKDALDEALCFGWVDSLVKRLDDQRYARKFTPRRADSRPPTDRSYGPLPPRYKLPSKVPGYIETALKRHPAALRHFEALTPSHRRRYLGWIESAKHDETKARRMREAIRLLTAGKPLGLK